MVYKTIEFTYHYLSAYWAHLQNVATKHAMQKYKDANARLLNAEDDREKNKIYKEIKMDTTDEKKDDFTSLCIDDQIDQCGEFKSGLFSKLRSKTLSEEVNKSNDQ